MDPLLRLHNLLIAAGIPITGVARDNGNFTVGFTPEATTQQQADAAAIVAAFDPTPRQPRTLAAITADINALTTQQKLDLRALLESFLEQRQESILWVIRAVYRISALTNGVKNAFLTDCAAAIIRDHPTLATDAGIPVPGDEPVP